MAAIARSICIFLNIKATSFLLRYGLSGKHHATWIINQPSCRHRVAIFVARENLSLHPVTTKHKNKAKNYKQTIKKKAGIHKQVVITMIENNTIHPSPQHQANHLFSRDHHQADFVGTAFDGAVADGSFQNTESALVYHTSSQNSPRSNKPN